MGWQPLWVACVDPDPAADAADGAVEGRVSPGLSWSGRRAVLGKRHVPDAGAWTCCRQGWSPRRHLSLSWSSRRTALGQAVCPASSPCLQQVRAPAASACRLDGPADALCWASGMPPLQVPRLACQDHWLGSACTPLAKRSAPECSTAQHSKGAPAPAAPRRTAWRPRCPRRALRSPPGWCTASPAAATLGSAYRWTISARARTTCVCSAGLAGR